MLAKFIPVCQSCVCYGDFVHCGRCDWLREDEECSLHCGRCDVRNKILSRMYGISNVFEMQRWTALLVEREQPQERHGSWC